MAKRRGLSWEDVFKGQGADDPARDTLKSKIAAACGFNVPSNGPKMRAEADELKKLRTQLTELLEGIKDSQVREAVEVRSLLEFGVKKIDDGFARISGELNR
jgi:hypothetical protein